MVFVYHIYTATVHDNRHLETRTMRITLSENMLQPTEIIVRVAQKFKCLGSNDEAINTLTIGKRLKGESISDISDSTAISLDTIVEKYLVRPFRTQHF